MSTATTKAYRSRFAGRIAPARNRKSPEIKPFHGHWSPLPRKAHCIKDRVLLDPTVGSGGMLIHSKQYVEEQGSDGNNLALFGQDDAATMWSICKMNMFMHDIPVIIAIPTPTITDNISEDIDAYTMIVSSEI